MAVNPSPARPRRTPRGPLPQRVYWFRRAMVIGTIAVVLFAVVRLVSGPEPQVNVEVEQGEANGAGDQVESAVLGPFPVKGAKRDKASKNQAARLTATRPCEDDEILANPKVDKAVGGSPVEVQVQLTGTAPACSFEVTPKSLAVRIVSGKDRIWSSQDCRPAIPRETVTVRAGDRTTVPVSWSGRRSDSECSKGTAWALPGYYIVSAAVIGSAPGRTQFKLRAPEAKVIVKRKPTKTKQAQKKQAQKKQAKQKQSQKKQKKSEPKSEQ